MNDSYPKPLPVPDADSAPFWQGCRDNKLLLQRCDACERHRFPPSSFCPHCRSAAAQWVQASGRGTVYSWITVRHPVPRDIYAADVPYIVALIALEEGVRMASNIVGSTPEAIEGSMAVEVVFDRVTPEITLPKFRPATAR